MAGTRIGPILRQQRLHAVTDCLPGAPRVTVPSPSAVPPLPLPLQGIEVPSQRWRESLVLIEQHLPFTRRTVHAGEAVQTAGQAFSSLCIVHSGAFKTVHLAADGREQVVGLHFKGDWIGFDSIASGRCACNIVAMDTGEVWSLRYVALLTAAASVPALMHAVCTAMSTQLARDREWRLALSTLSADGRVADFLRAWAESLAERGLRIDQITLGLSRGEIGNHLGLTLETVSRAFSRLALGGLIRFDGKGRRTISVPSVAALAEFVRGVASVA
ncbi:MAG: Crp/Fnr family transcriptional regulator [Bacteriovorax sp.]|nr:Crp/Fnr family transcriptional regulator [Rhizobacter sp.]